MELCIMYMWHVKSGKAKNYWSLLRVGWHLTALSTQIRLPVCCAVRSVKFIVTYLIINYLFTALTVVLLQV